MIDRKHPLPLVQQCQILELSRSSVYYLPQPLLAADLALMRQIDELHRQYPFAGSRMLRDILQLNGMAVGRKHVATLMRRMGIEALYQRPRTTTPHPGIKFFRTCCAIDRSRLRTRPGLWTQPDIRMRRGLVYLAAVSWTGRSGALSWRLSNSLTVDFCLQAVEAAIRDWTVFRRSNRTKCSEFTGSTFVDMVQQHGIQISMDGKGSWRDNVFVERLWKSVNMRKVHRTLDRSAAEARQGLQRYFSFYNQRRPHSSLDGRTPGDRLLRRAAHLRQPEMNPAELHLGQLFCPTSRSHRYPLLTSIVGPTLELPPKCSILSSGLIYVIATMILVGFRQPGGKIGRMKRGR